MESAVNIIDQIQEVKKHYSFDPPHQEILSEEIQDLNDLLTQNLFPLLDQLMEKINQELQSSDHEELKKQFEVLKQVFIQKKQESGSPSLLSHSTAASSPPASTSTQHSEASGSNLFAPRKTMTTMFDNEASDHEYEYDHLLQSSESDQGLDNSPPPSLQIQTETTAEPEEDEPPIGTENPVSDPKGTKRKFGQ